MKPISEHIMKTLRAAEGLDENDTSRDEEIRNYPQNHMFAQWFNYVFDIDDSDILNSTDISVLNVIEDIWEVDLSGTVCIECGNALPREEQKMKYCSDCR